jgi:DNA-binding response OmpR family regulator
LLAIFGARKSKQKGPFMNTAVTATRTHMAVLIADNRRQNHIDLFDYLQMRGFHAEWVVSELDLRTQLRQQAAASVLLDLDLPGGAGVEWAKRIRSELGYRAGIIMLTSSNAVEDRIKGWECGADAYLQRPVNLNELEVILQHIENRLTLSFNNNEPPAGDEWQLDLTTAELITPDQQRVPLTGTETRLLMLMADNAGQSVDRETLCNLLPPSGAHDDTRRLDALLSRLRSKVKKQTAQRLPLTTYRNKGYAFTAPMHNVGGPA